MITVYFIDILPIGDCPVSIKHAGLLDYLITELLEYYSLGDCFCDIFSKSIYLFCFY